LCSGRQFSGGPNIARLAGRLDLDLPTPAGLLPSNRLQIDECITELMEFRRDGIGLLGLSFKPGTDDLRESPMVTVVETLLGRGATVRIHDPSLNLTKLVGSNLRYIQTEIPHIANLLHGSAAEVVQASQAIVVAHNTPAFQKAVQQTRPQQTVFDLVHLPERELIPARYVGVCW